MFCQVYIRISSLFIFGFLYFPYPHTQTCIYIPSFNLWTRFIMYLTSRYYRKLPCCNTHHFLSMSMYITLRLICRIMSKLNQRSTELLQPALALMSAANNVISGAYVRTSAFFFFFEKAKTRQFSLL